MVQSHTWRYQHAALLLMLLLRLDKKGNPQILLKFIAFLLMAYRFLDFILIRRTQKRIRRLTNPISYLFVQIMRFGWAFVHAPWKKIEGFIYMLRNNKSFSSTYTTLLKNICFLENPFRFIYCDECFSG